MDLNNKVTIIDNDLLLNNKDKIIKIFKNNIIIVFIAYFIGTCAVLIRNYFYGFPFSPINLLQSFVIFFYIALFGYVFIFVKNKFELILVKKHRIISQIAQLMIVYIVLIVIVFLLNLLNYKVLFTLPWLYVIMPIISVCDPNKYILFFWLSIISLFWILLIPLQFGGLSPQEVIFYDYDTKNTSTYSFFGTANDFYQFKDGKNVIIIPIDKGYISYEYINEFANK